MQRNARPRKSILVAVLLCFLIIACVAWRSSGEDADKFFSSGSRVTMVTSDTAMTFITATHKPVIILFYAPWCGHCQRFKDEYLRLATVLGDTVRLGAVNCDEQPSLAHKFNVRGYPTIMTWPMGKKTYTMTPEEYQGPRSAAGIQKHILMGLKTDKVQWARSETEIEQVVSQAPLEMAAVFFSGRAKPPPMMTVMSYSKALQPIPFVFVSNEISAEVGKAYNVTKIPTVALVQKDAILGVIQSRSVGMASTYKDIASFFQKHMEHEKKRRRKASKNSGEEPPEEPTEQP